MNRLDFVFYVALSHPAHWSKGAESAGGDALLSTVSIIDFKKLSPTEQTPPTQQPLHSIYEADTHRTVIVRLQASNPYLIYYDYA